jgi:hypothetical protein
MKKLLLAATTAMLMTLVGCTENMASQSALPNCDDPETKKIFMSVVNPWDVLELKNIEGSDPKKRWCYAYYIRRGFNGSFPTDHIWLGVRTTPHMEAVFTLEWVNKSEGRFWLQVRESGPTCRGVMGDPWSRERCGQSRE